jgi:hypothetical protein
LIEVSQFGSYSYSFDDVYMHFGGSPGSFTMDTLRKDPQLLHVWHVIRGFDHKQLNEFLDIVQMLHYNFLSSASLEPDGSVILSYKFNKWGDGRTRFIEYRDSDSTRPLKFPIPSSLNSAILKSSRPDIHEILRFAIKREHVIPSETRNLK